MLDVAYLRLLIQAGPVVVLLLAWLYGKTMKESWHLRDRMTCLILGIFVIFGLCESGFNNMLMNFTLVLVVKPLFDADLPVSGNQAGE